MGLTAIGASLRPDEFSTDLQLRPSPLVYRKRTYDTGQNTPKSQYFQYLTELQRKATQSNIAMEKQVKTKVWEQQPKESDPAYAAFSIYRDMGKNRTVAAVVRECGKNRSLIDRWHKGHNWAARCRAYDNSIDEEARKKAAVEAANIRKTHLQIAAQLQLKALNALNLLAPEDMTPRDIKEMLKLALEVENNLVLEKAPQEDATAAPTLMQTIEEAYQRRMDGETPHDE